jgi:iron complex transport system ATP-binding protein
MTIEARGLSVAYGRRRVLHDVDFTARPGEVTMIIGPNGSGKTTLMRALTGDLASTGTISVNGRALQSCSAHELAAIRAVLPQETILAFPFTVAEVVGLGVAAGPVLASPEARLDRIASALDAVDLPGFAGRTYQELSGGERQRVQLARVLCQIWNPVSRHHGPRWLFLDEPVSSLDIRHQLMIMDLASGYARRGGGVIAVMHDLNLTAMFADRIALVSSGRVAGFGSPEEVLKDDLLADVFGCALKVGEVPRDRLFVLPQAISAG